MVTIFDGKRGYYAHVGDGAIIGLKTDGSYTEISQYQNVDGRVIPLRAGYEFWRIDEIKEPLVSILIATDGMADQFKNSNLEQGFYVPLLMLFADPYCIQFQKRKGVNIAKVVTHGQSGYNKTLINALYHTLYRNYHLNRITCNKIVGDVMRNGTPFELLRKIQDDKTFVCLYNTAAFPKAQGLQYYAEPDWKQVTANLQKRLYPSMFEESKPVKQEKTDQPQLLHPTPPEEAKSNLASSTDELMAKIMLRIRKNE